MRKRGRGRPSKITATQAQEIRDWYEQLRALPSAQDLAQKYGVCDTTIYQIARGMLHKQAARERMRTEIGQSCGMSDRAPAGVAS